MNRLTPVGWHFLREAVHHPYPKMYMNMYIQTLKPEVKLYYCAQYSLEVIYMQVLNSPHQNPWSMVK